MKPFKISLIAYLLSLIFLSSPVLSATGGNPSALTFPYTGTVKVYFKISPITQLNTITLTKEAQNTTFDFPPGGATGVIDSHITTFEVIANDVIRAKLHNTSLNVDGAGWTDPTGVWICGTAGAGDGLQSFADLETLAESNNTPIIARHCWEDWGGPGSDNDFNDMIIIYTYDQIVYSTPTPGVGAIDYFGIKLGPQATPGIGGFQLKVCPTDISKYNFWGPFSCIFFWPGI